MLGLLEQRANYYTGTTNSMGLKAQVARSFCEGFKCSNASKLLAFRTKTYKNAPMRKGRWPLVIYLASYGSMGYENILLLEALARRGYVVAAINSIGRFPGDMTTEKEDLFEQVNDAVFSIRHLYNNPAIDFQRIAVIGYSWGGLAGNLLPGKIPDIACIVSLEGSEFHHYGQKDPDAKKEDSNFNSLVQTAAFRDRSMTVPYLRFESSPSSANDGFDSVYNFGAGMVNKEILRVINGKHEDFCSIGPIVKASGNCEQDDKYAAVVNLTLSFIDEKIRNQNAFRNMLEKYLNRSVVEVK
ncbi:MAG TPA: CocE/NonD family hydrolase [Puia sp.]|nr:CocE/NonD family hydrolase [Puia sp.]